MPGREQADPLEQGPVGEQVLEGEVFEKRLAVELRPIGGVGENRLDLRAEQERSALLRVVERLDAVTVAGEEQPALLAIPDGEGEHPVEAVERRLSPCRVGVEHNLGVAP